MVRSVRLLETGELLPNGRVSARTSIASCLLGVCVFFLAVQLCARIIVGTNCSVCVHGGLATHNVIFSAYFLGVTSLITWCLYARRLSSPLAALTAAAALGVVALVVVAQGDSVSELLKFYVAYFYAFIGSLVSGGLAVMLAISQTPRKPRLRDRWLVWWGTGGASIVLGLILFQWRPDSFLGYLARVVTILVVPAICLLATAGYYRGRWAIPVSFGARQN